MARIRSKGPNPVDVEILDDDGRPLHGVARASIDLHPEYFTQVHMTVYLIQSDIEGENNFYIQHPQTGEVKEIQQITFTDGEVWEAKE